jgi:hypothetical protein
MAITSSTAPAAPLSTAAESCGILPVTIAQNTLIRINAAQM